MPSCDQRFGGLGGIVRTVVDREPPAPTPLDEVMSVMFLESAPWVRARIKHLRLTGRLAAGWTPPRVADPCRAFAKFMADQ
jgi:hypothetical protein